MKNLVKNLLSYNYWTDEGGPYRFYTNFLPMTLKVTERLVNIFENSYIQKPHLGVSSSCAWVKLVK